jgi:adenylate cyclase
MDLTHAHSSAIDSMALVVESRDTETGAHILRTKEYIACLGEYLYEHDIYKSILTKEFRELVYRASPLHDIGKVAIPDNILKKPAKLTTEEFIIMKDHASIGKEIIQNALKGNEENVFLKRALNIAYSHHEKWDGSGYPQGLKGIEIPLEARLMALADVYDALISRRVYKESIPFEQSEQIIIEGSGNHFDPVLVAAFIELKDKFRDIADRIR